MKKIMLLVLLDVIFFHSIYTQNTLNTGLMVPYDPCTGCSDNNPANPIYQATDFFDDAPHVRSDFGPRYVVRSSGDVPYDWHGGIDYSAAVGIADRGYHLRSITGGTVHIIGGGGVKYIVINGEEHDFGYLHIFSNGAPPRNNGDCSLVALAPPYNDKLGILIPDANTNEGFILISDCVNCEDHYYVHNGITLYATNEVDEGQIIAVLGDSGAAGNGHLHLNRYESLANGMDFINGDANMLNPLEFVEHWNPDYVISLHNHSQIVTDPEDEPQGIILSYPGSQSSRIMVRPRMNDEGNSNFYDHGTLNISEVELLTKKNYQSDWVRINGANYEARITLGATVQNNTTYPNYVGVTGVVNKGGWNRQGIFHFAYRDATDNHGAPYTTDGGHPYDDFYFTDFITRIHKDDPMDGATTPTMLSYCPMSARYNDGRYHLKSRVTNVREQATDSPVQNVVIDDYPQNILNGKYYVLKCLRYLTLSEFYFFFAIYTRLS